MNIVHSHSNEFLRHSTVNDDENSWGMKLDTNEERRYSYTYK